MRRENSCTFERYRARSLAGAGVGSVGRSAHLHSA
jgi:hypothetical protein